MIDERTTAAGPLWRLLRSHPRVSDKGRARWRLVDLSGPLDAALADKSRRHVRPLLASIADHSPYLWRLIEADPQRCIDILESDPVAYLDALLTDLRTHADDAEADLLRRLRRAKQAVALLVAMADLGGAWSLEQAMEALSRSADTFIGTALAFLLRQAHLANRLKLDLERPEDACGLAVLGLGKLGGRELNYSSDVDLIVLFDPESPAVVDRDEAKVLFVRMVRDLVRLLQQPTADGYVLRVDLRLRPEPSASAVAVGIGSAFLYYEQFGQNWERAALIKARPVAGDRGLAAEFMAGLTPFLWRKYLDFAAIADIHAMKRQIHAAKGGGTVAVAGHNLKLGRGGIRDIEFFVQTQQLIFGGKRPDLRGSRTLPMLRQLRREGWISKYAVGDLTRAYEFLRRTEHRLQMLADAQTHSLPHRPEALERFAHFCGFASTAKFAEVAERHFRLVVHHYALLFEHAPMLDNKVGNLIFTGVDNDPGTLQTLARLGYKAPEAVASTVRAWHSGLRPSVRSMRARETLTDLVPKLLVTFSRTSDPDAAVAGFDRSLAHLPAAAELFALLTANATVRTLYGDILGSAPRLADAVASHPHLLDIAIDPSVSVCLDEDAVGGRVAAALVHAETTEDLLDAIRDYQHEEHFLIGVRLLSGALDVDDAGRAYSALAVGIIRAVLAHLERVFQVDHGRPPGSALALVAMGKLGSQEMSASSDLDLVLIYEFDADRAESDGPKPIHAQTYFTRLTQRLITSLTVSTKRGRLYDVDMRLRPSGNQGPLATKLSAFAAYQRTTAQTWEHMALTRARIVAGDADLSRRVATEIKTILCSAVRPGLVRDVVEMRAMLGREKPPTGPWDLKLVDGGLLDVEFIAQYLALREAAARPEILSPSMRAVIERAARLGAIDDEAGRTLVSAHRLYSRTTQIIRVALPAEQVADMAGTGLKRRLAEGAGVATFAQLKADLSTTRQAVVRVFDEFLPS